MHQTRAMLNRSQSVCCAAHLLASLPLSASLRCTSAMLDVVTHIKHIHIRAMSITRVARLTCLRLCRFLRSSAASQPCWLGRQVQPAAGPSWAAAP
jgi:hypothetical protein